MRVLNPAPAVPLPGTSFTRPATRAIITRQSQILLLYTQRYDDYTLPGGGVDEGESLTDALVREVKEETGARSVTNIAPFGIYEEYQHWYKPDYDNVHIVSHCYQCEICGEFDEPEMEHYEVSNGMQPQWVEITEAIAHNEAVLANSDKQGQSLLRETRLLKLIAKELMQLNF
ncbi:MULTISPECIES: NUDIX domain-containing protein [Pseudoalteromonas]|uniref:NUDIX domain-containing protein n=1 Tax=Pseudoalteromonas rubra TaxID=43658 RepID=A0A5S3UVC2_9GAMM|nr:MULTISPECIES: NUDIX domain-containing protein [Pseudoalteromonas]MCG7564034.1 NUDIX domain-containing protein [Pseudoalteromonas sp. McH1-42]QPB84190.1 NUDIX domain-containing protein [Pseudoalteromonas rubra]